MRDCAPAGRWRAPPIGRLRREIALQKQLEAEARGLRGIRERTLHEVADDLHDTAVSDVRGLQLWLAGVRRKVGEEMEADFAFLDETLEKTYRDARRIIKNIALRQEEDGRDTPWRWPGRGR